MLVLAYLPCYVFSMKLLLIKKYIGFIKDVLEMIKLQCIFESCILYRPLSSKDIQKNRDPTNWDFNHSIDSICSSKVLQFLSPWLPHQIWNYIPRSIQKSVRSSMPTLKQPTQFRHHPFCSKYHTSKIPQLNGYWKMQK